MITLENLKELLKTLSFEENGNIFKKSISRAVLQIDFNRKEIIYPAGLTVNERQTCNFSSNENFVVFECVHRLLEKGYLPEHLELEPRWQLGHGASGGRADILVKDHQNKPLLMIECKTADKEFEKEKKKMQSNGGQLFSYLAQDRNTQYLCLYASDFDKDIQYNNLIVKIQDRKEDEEAFKEDDTIKLYKNAKSNKELFEVWKETYNLYFHLNGIFEDDVNAYSIELKPLKKKNLKPLDEAQGIFNIFMEILRHNNISDNANAFNRMLSLLLCKIVDEEKGDNEILGFQVKEEEDNPEKIQDRLQKLYAQGMKEHLDEEIVYFEDKVIRDIIKKYPKQTPIEKVEDIFRQIKYYTQNEFALKEVHNKALFEQNARVLNEIIRMLQNYRFLYTKKQQILGDFFELLLSHGVKQSEGQFFTPVPIVRFIILSLGLDKIIHEKISNTEKNFLPKILDYACGSGHFLTESINELQNHIQKLNKDAITDKDQIKSLKKYKNSTEWAEEYIFGVEKDYRLARTSQIACFLNGDGDANIIYGDGLVEHKKLNTKKKPFDVVIANPPYAIKACKNYLPIKSENYQVYDCLTETSGEIEAFFVERTAQVLKEKGKAGIILPSSILSSDSKPYTKAREILLENFEIKAVAEFGSGTFGATGTSTVVLFLQKRSADFKTDRKYICEDIFAGVERNKKLEHIDSAALLQKFVNHRRIELADYQSLLKRQANNNIKKSELWLEYISAFGKSINEAFYKKMLTVEASKFYYFMLGLNDKHLSQKTVLVKTGEKDTARAFIGYKFSNRKGSEGIEIIKDGNDKPSTNLYDDDDHGNPQKANSYIIKNFWDEEIKEIDETMKEHIFIANLTDMLDFDRRDFNKAINLNPQQNADIETKWELVKLGDVCKLKAGGTPSRSEKKYWDNGNIFWLKINDYKDFDEIYSTKEKITEKGLNNSSAQLIEKDTVVISIFATIGRVGIVKTNMATNQAIVGLAIKDNQKLIPKYLINSLFKYSSNLKIQAVGMAQPNVNATKLSNLKIPLPPLEVQQKIANECEAVDKEAEKARQTIIINKQQIEMLVNSVEKSSKLNQIVKRISDIVNPQEKNGLVNYVGLENIESNTGILLDNSQSDFSVIRSNKNIFQKGDILYGKLRPNLNKVYLADINGICSTDILVLRPHKLDLSIFYKHFFLSKEFNSEVLNTVSGQQLPRTSWEKINQIPVPPLSIQKRLVAQVEKLETKITQARAVIDNAAERKNAILKKHL